MWAGDDPKGTQPISSGARCLSLILGTSKASSEVRTDQWGRGGVTEQGRILLSILSLNDQELEPGLRFFFSASQQLCKRTGEEMGCDPNYARG